MRGVRTLFPLIPLIFSSTLFSQEGWMPGIGPTMATSSSLLGFNARGYYGVDERFCFGPELSFFPYQKIGEDHETSLLELNLNAHYVFEFAHRLGFYPLGGFNYSFENERSDASSIITERHRAVGLNYGFGMHYGIDRVLLFGEIKGVIGELNDEFLTFGIVVLLKNPKKH